MVKKDRKGFTLIELIAVLVIMAIIALIVTPLVMSIIRKARISADKRSVDAYGRSIELAIAGYLLDTGTFPTEVSQLTIEYSGSRVECETTQINSDSSVYLAGCTVAGRSVEGYTYGENKGSTSEPSAPTNVAYNVGDQVTYNGVDYYVLANSEVSNPDVTLLKVEPLSVAEVNEYGAGHVNMRATSDTGSSYYQKAYNQNGYGGMQYYSSETCGYVNYSWVNSGCTRDYAQSEVKYVVDAWKTANAPAATEARLITLNDLTDSLGYEQGSSGIVPSSENTPSWIYNSNYTYWTMTPYNDTTVDVWGMDADGQVDFYNITYGISRVVRPVITISKSYVSPKGN